MAAGLYFLLFRDGRKVRAAEASHLVADDFALAVSLRGREYRRIKDPFIFWNEFRDPSGRTVGYTFLSPPGPSLTNRSALVRPPRPYRPGVRRGTLAATARPRSRALVRQTLRPKAGRAGRSPQRTRRRG